MEFLNEIMKDIPQLPLFTSGGGFTPMGFFGSLSLRSDTFNRANDTQLGTPSDTGSNWIDLNSAGHISSNTAIGNPGMSAGEYHPVVLESVSSSTYSISVKVTVSQTGSTSGVIYDYDDSGGAGFETYSGILFGSDLSDTILVRVENGSFIFSLPIFLTIANGDEIVLKPWTDIGVVGVYINGSLHNIYPAVNTGTNKQGLILSNDSAFENFYILRESEANSDLDLYTYGIQGDSASLPLFVQGMGFPCSFSLPLTCWNNGVSGTLSLYVSGDGVESGALSVFETLMLYVQAPYGAMLPLYTVGTELTQINDSLDLYCFGVYTVSSSAFPLSIPMASSTKTGTITLYTHGF